MPNTGHKIGNRVITKSYNTILMIKHFNIFLFILFLLSFVGCSTTRYVPIKETEREVVNYKDSIRIRDSIVVIPVERIVDVVPAYDTLNLETTQAKAKAYVDTTLHLLRGSIENKAKAKTEVREVVKFVERTDTIYVEKPVPYEVEKKVRYVPAIYKLSLIFMIAAIGLTVIRLFLRYKFKI